MTLPDDLLAWREQFLAEFDINLGDLMDPEFEHPGTQAAELEESTAGRIPLRYAGALATDPGVRQWMAAVLRQAITDRRIVASVTTGPSLLLLGPTGTGKTFQAYGALRGIAACGVRARWTAAPAADLYARMRPRHGVDSETEFRAFADARPLILDDLGVAKGSEWVEEVNYRLVNHRYEHALPTIFTSNILPKDLAEMLGGRVASRLHEMTTRVSLKGTDRRYGDGRAA